MINFKLVKGEFAMKRMQITCHGEIPFEQKQKTAENQRLEKLDLEAKIWLRIMDLLPAKSICHHPTTVYAPTLYHVYAHFRSNLSCCRDRAGISRSQVTTASPTPLLCDREPILSISKSMPEPHPQP